ncbi:MAG TPA: hypothetical protein VFG78_11610 [Gemmatimonadota bacterium]|nr:hypothetical protein [Gemmatimonadota bacterium]
MAGRSSLIGFHRVLISAGIVFCVGFATYAWYRGQITLSIVFGILAILLVAYLWNLSRVLGYRDE